MFVGKRCDERDSSHPFRQAQADILFFEVAKATRDVLICSTANAHRRLFMVVSKIPWHILQQKEIFAMMTSQRAIECQYSIMNLLRNLYIRITGFFLHIHMLQTYCRLIFWGRQILKQ
jgi:hypothetical protein